MAKQSFVTGQVLTAQQVNDLQTNDFNQTVSAKTASYTLVAADKGTRITMSSTSATTITVNTGLFAAGDTLFIQNLNTGVCTITAGTATVDTSASLALAQHEGGTLYFTSAGVSTFFKAAGAAASGGGKTLLSTTTLSGSSTSITSIDQTYKDLFLIGNIITGSDTGITIRYNSNATSGDYSSHRLYGETGLTPGAAAVGSGDVGQSSSATAWNTQTYIHMNIYRYAETELKQSFAITRCTLSSGTSPRLMYNHGSFNSTAAISSIQIGGSSLSGTVYLYGVK